MKSAWRRFFGRLLVWAGAIILTVVLYASVRQYLPAPYRYAFVIKLVNDLKTKLNATLRPELTPYRFPEPIAGPTPNPPPPVASSAPPPAAPTGLLTGEIHQTRGMYNLWIWGIKPEKKASEAVAVEIAHAAAGENGGFWIVAFADTDNDDQPDREIARSQFLTASQPAQWSGFSFKTAEKKIYVGAAWPEGKNTWVYRQEGEWPLPDPPLEGRFYYVVSPEQVLSAGPAFTNLKLSFYK